MQASKKPYILKVAEQAVELINSLPMLPVKHYYLLSNDMLAEIAEIHDCLGSHNFRRAFADGLITKDQIEAIEKFIRWDRGLSL
jgi:hypothetical protein